MIEPCGFRTGLVLGLDSVMMCLYKSAEGWQQLPKSSKEKRLLVRIPLKAVRKVEPGIYNDRRLYIWYAKDEERRIDIALKKQAEAAKVLSKMRFLLRRINES